MEKSEIHGSKEIFSERPIPTDLPVLLGWKEIPVMEGGEKLVPLGPFSENDRIFTHSIYFGEKKDSPYESEALEGSLITMFVRESVANQLKRAQCLLPKGLHLIVFDAYRTLEVQQSLFDVYFTELKIVHPEWSEDKLMEETQKYVSIPSRNPERPSPHNTGGSVDVAIFKLAENVEAEFQQISKELEVLEDWEKAYQLEMRRLSLIEKNLQLLDFGTKFDHGGVEASLNYFEKLGKTRILSPEEQVIRKNRRFLFNLMTEVGFEPYEDEWWHFNSKKSQMGAKTAGLNIAEYGAVRLSAENQKHEQMRKMHWQGTFRIFSGEFNSKLGIINNSKEMEAARLGVRVLGNIRDTESPQAAIIKPVGQAA